MILFLSHSKFLLVYANAIQGIYLLHEKVDVIKMFN